MDVYCNLSPHYKLFNEKEKNKTLKHFCLTFSFSHTLNFSFLSHTFKLIIPKPYVFFMVISLSLILIFVFVFVVISLSLSAFYSFISQVVSPIVTIYSHLLSHAVSSTMTLSLIIVGDPSMTKD